MINSYFEASCKINKDFFQGNLFDIKFLIIMPN